MNSFSISNKGGAWLVLLNDVDITTTIADGGVKIHCRPWPLPPAVQLTLIPSAFSVDFPEAEVGYTPAEQEACA